MCGSRMDLDSGSIWIHCEIDAIVSTEVLVFKLMLMCSESTSDDAVVASRSSAATVLLDSNHSYGNHLM